MVRHLAIAATASFVVAAAGCSARDAGGEGASVPQPSPTSGRQGAAEGARTLTIGELEGHWLPVSAFGVPLGPRQATYQELLVDGGAVRFTYGCLLYRGRLHLRRDRTVAPTLFTRDRGCDLWLTEDLLGPDTPGALESAVRVDRRGSRLVLRDAAGGVVLVLRRSPGLPSRTAG